MKTKSALSYFGSDSEVAEELAAMLDNCKHVTIPFCGGLSILPWLKARAIVANDLNGLAINFYRVLAGHHGEAAMQTLITRCQNTLSHPEEMELATSITCVPTVGYPIERAWAYWAQCWIGRKGKGGTKNAGGLPSVRRTANGGSNASRIVAAAKDLESWAQQFKRCEFEAVCFRELIPKIADQSDCGIYIDAPWVKAGRSYLHAFNEKDHIDLAALLHRFKHSPIVIRYDNAELLHSLYSDGWEWKETASRTQSNGLVSEVWITKRAALNGQPQ